MTNAGDKMVERFWDLSHTYNVCSTAASDSYRDLGNTVRAAVDIYQYLMSLADPRVGNWLLMTSPWPTVFITLGYLFVVAKGPHFMENRKPFELTPLILGYNALVTGLNLYIGVELFLTSRQLDFSWQCEPVDYSDNPLALRVASALW